MSEWFLQSGKFGQYSETVYQRQYRQQALISDFLDLANLSVQEEAALATNWIDDRPEGLKLQNLELATMAGTQNQMRIFGLRETIDPSRESISDCSNIFLRIGSPSTVAILTSLRPAVNPLPGCSSGKPIQDQLA